MTMRVRIFKPAKSAMQSGRKNTKKWLMLPVEENNFRSINPMGWVSADSTIPQLHFEFSSKEAAIKFAQEKNFSHQVEEPRSPNIKPKSYAENFTK